MWVKNLAVHLNELSAVAKLIDILVAQEVWTDQRRGIRKIQGILCYLIPISHEFLPGCLYDVYALIISDGIGGSREHGHGKAMNIVCARVFYTMQNSAKTKREAKIYRGDFILF